MKFTIFFFYTFSFLIGSVFVQHKFVNSRTGQLLSSGDVLSVLIALMTGFMTFLSAMPNIQAMIASKMVGGVIFGVIDRVPAIRDSPKCEKNVKLTEGIYF